MYWCIDHVNYKNLINYHHSLFFRKLNQKIVGDGWLSSSGCTQEHHGDTVGDKGVQKESLASCFICVDDKFTDLQKIYKSVNFLYIRSTLAVIVVISCQTKEMLSWWNILTCDTPPIIILKKYFLTPIL